MRGVPAAVILSYVGSVFASTEEIQAAAVNKPVPEDQSGIENQPAANNQAAASNQTDAANEAAIDKTCPQGAEWTDCGTPCPLGCMSPPWDEPCHGDCVPGCQCIERHIISAEGHCIPLETCPPGSLIFLSEQEASDYFHGLDQTILEWYEQHLDRYGNDTVEATGNEVTNTATEGAQLPASEPQPGENEVQLVVDEKSQPISKQQDKPAVDGKGQPAAEVQPVAKE